MNKDCASLAETLMAAALSYSGYGTPVFPCMPGAKNPIVAGGFRAATLDPKMIRAWWERWPTANIGMPTGGITDTLVLDVDPRNGGDRSLAALEASYGPTDTARATTGGGGVHYYFRHPGGHQGCTKIGEGLDIKCDGGYVLVPPSITTRLYAWAPDGGVRRSCPLWLLAAVGRARVHVASTSGPLIEGARNDTLFRIACSLRRWELSASEISAMLAALNEMKCRPPLGAKEISTIVNSAIKY